MHLRVNARFLFLLTFFHHPISVDKAYFPMAIPHLFE